MIELINDELIFSFPEVHPEAILRINFQRTLRIPDDDNNYPLPPGLGSFPLRHVDDFHEQVPDKWLEHGGVMLPMYQSEAMWLCFRSDFLNHRATSYPFAVKVGTGKINAISGETIKNGLSRRPHNYAVVPMQPWLDGYCVEKGIIRQFIAMPLGAGYTAEEQLTEESKYGGLQLIVFPMKGEVFDRRFPIARYKRLMIRLTPGAMGLAPGGRMKQEVYEDPFKLDDWEVDRYSRCFVHIANSMVWRAITGQSPPTVPLTSEQYNRYGLPWFEYYDEKAKALSGAGKLKNLLSVAAFGKKKGDVPLPENASLEPTNIIKLSKGLKRGQVREGTF
jgi:hypothetical protein